jgi:hypothetical protein
MMGYTDFENADINDTLFNYGLDDNIPGYKISNIDWSKVIDKLVSFIGSENIVFNTEVKSIKEMASSSVASFKKVIEKSRSLTPVETTADLDINAWIENISREVEAKGAQRRASTTKKTSTAKKPKKKNR